MRALVQRVSEASVEVAGQEVAAIEQGLLVLLGIHRDDGPEDVSYLAGKVSRLRIFDDEEGRMNLDLAACGGKMLVVSQFTLYGDSRKGNRPGYTEAAPPAMATKLYEAFCEAVSSLGHSVQTGEFGAMMKVRLLNDGPVTLLLESR